MMETGISTFDTFTDLLSIAGQAFLIRVDFMGFMVRPLDFLLFLGTISLLVDLFRMIVMRGNDD